MNKPIAPQLHHFYRTSSLPCPYVSGRTERKVITELAGADAQGLYNNLSRAGFRRSHQLAYRPACPGCCACQPVRIDADRFVASRSARRLKLLNADLDTAVIDAQATMEQYALFTRYQSVRHGESDMAAMNYVDYRAMIEDSPVDTILLTLRDKIGQLCGTCLVDCLDDGVSAVYSFYDPDLPRRSLGTWLVLELVALVRQLRLPYVYLGYWIGESRKMGYKTRFQPLEALSPLGWMPFKLPDEEVG